MSMEVPTMRELIADVPNLAKKIEDGVSEGGAYFFTMYGSYKSNLCRIDEKYKSAIRQWCKEYGYKLEDLHDYYHTFKISNIY